MGATGTEGLWMGQCTRAGLCVWELRVVTLGTEISPSLSFLLCKMEHGFCSPHLGESKDNFVS